MHAVVCHDQPCRPSLDFQACAHMFPYYCHCVHAESAVTIAPSHVPAPHPAENVPIFPCLGSSCPTPMHDLHVSCMASTLPCMQSLCQAAVSSCKRLPRYACKSIIFPSLLLRSNDWSSDVIARATHTAATTARLGPATTPMHETWLSHHHPHDCRLLSALPVLLARLHVSLVVE